MFLHELAHVDAHDRRFVVEERFRQRFAQLRFADAGRAEEEERADRPVRILKSAAASAHGVGDRVDRFVLSDDAQVQSVFEHEQFRAFGLHHSGHGHAGPLRDDVGDFVRSDDLTQQPFRLLPFRARLAVRLLLFFLLIEALLQILNLVVQVGELLEIGVVDARAMLKRLLNRRV